MKIQNEKISKNGDNWIYGVDDSDKVNEEGNNVMRSRVGKYIGFNYVHNLYFKNKEIVLNTGEIQLSKALKHVELVNHVSALVLNFYCFCNN